MDWLQLIYAITSFLDQGGTILYIIAVAAFLLWFLTVERLLYIYFKAPVEKKRLTKIWHQNRQNPEASRIRESLKNTFQHKLLFTLPLMRTLVRITPLLGLYGTVYGMIEIFDVISQQGTGDARALANGISMATLPTMTGMAIAIIGIVLLRYVEASANRTIALLNDVLDGNDHESATNPAS
jgi:biopolymer transport protein ExbB